MFQKTLAITLFPTALTLGLLAAAPSRSLADDARLPTALAIPMTLSQSIAAHYDIGRGAWDMGGVSSITTFGLDAFASLGVGSPTYLAIVMPILIATTQADRADDLGETCGVDPDQGAFEPIADLDACAAWLLTRAQGSGRVLDEAMVRLRSDEQTNEASTFNQGLDELATYLYGEGRRYLEVHGRGEDYGLDLHTVLLLDQERAVAHLVRYDRGA